MLQTTAAEHFHTVYLHAGNKSYWQSSKWTAKPHRLRTAKSTPLRLGFWMRGSSRLSWSWVSVGRTREILISTQQIRLIYPASQRGNRMQSLSLSMGRTAAFNGFAPLIRKVLTLDPFEAWKTALSFQVSIGFNTKIHPIMSALFSQFILNYKKERRK